MFRGSHVFFRLSISCFLHSWGNHATPTIACLRAWMGCHDHLIIMTYLRAWKGFHDQYYIPESMNGMPWLLWHTWEHEGDAMIIITYLRAWKGCHDHYYITESMKGMPWSLLHTWEHERDALIIITYLNEWMREPFITFFYTRSHRVNY